MSEPTLLRVLRAEDVRPRRRCPVDPATLRQATTILEDITSGGDAAALRHAQRLGDLKEGDRVIYGPDELRAAADRLDAGSLALLRRTAGRIRDFALAQRACMTDLTTSIPGGQAGHECLPVRFAGCYAPGGRFPLPSSVLMTALTARAAGVERVWVASPRPTDETLAAASIAGADGLLAVGGVQGIAALARGLLGVPGGGCDLIVGPGNRWVTAAKWLLSGEVGIDMLAGPSELAILADHTGDPALIAADLLAQAEHDDDAVPILVSTSDEIVARVDRELRRQLEQLPTPGVARHALANGYAVVVGSMDEAVAVCDRIGPEHVEVHAGDAALFARAVRNAGAVFVGASAAEVLGDYGIGPNHVLPTGGSCRYKGGLSVLTFLRVRTWMRLDEPSAAADAIADAVGLAGMEGLVGHARSAERRMTLPEPAG